MPVGIPNCIAYTARVHLLKTIRKMLNLGGAELTLTAQRLMIPQGGCVAGQVVAAIGEMDLEPRKVVLKLMRYRCASPDWERRSRVWLEIASKNLSGPCVLHAGKRYVFPFSLRLPFACETSGPSVQEHEHTWALVAYLDLPLAIDPFVQLPIHVVAHRIAQALAKVIWLSTGFTVLNKKGLFDENDGSINYVLAPPNARKPVVTQVFMSVMPRPRGGAEVIFGFQYRSKSIAQQTRLPGMGKIRIRSVTFRRQDLMDARNIFKRTAVSQEFSRQFSEMLSFS